MQDVAAIGDDRLVYRTAEAALIVTPGEEAMSVATQTRTERHRGDHTKANGVVYTPPALARFLAAQTFDALDNSGPVRILDPACGDGELLVAAVTEAERRSVTVGSVVGYDICPAAIDGAAKRLSGVPGVDLRTADFVDHLLRPLEPLDLFDVVISNPPYVRTQTLGSSVAQSLAQRFGLKGRVDLYQVFAAAMIQAMAPRGAIGLLCSNKFLTNRTGSSMRKLLLHELDLWELVDLGDTKLFGAAVLPVIVTGTRARSDLDRSRATRFRSVYEVAPHRLVEDTQPIPVLEALTEGTSGVISDSGRTFAIREGLLDSDAGPDRPWNPMDVESKERFVALRRSRATELGAIGKIRVGVKTTADPVFIRADWSDLPTEQSPEEGMLRPLLTHKDIEPWQANPGSRQILYPYRDSNGRAEPIELDSYPRTAAYLEQHRQRLENRKYVMAAGREWFEIWVPHKPAVWKKPKVVFPDIAASPRFAIDNSGAIVNGDCYWIPIEDEDLAEVVTAVGNSSFCTWFYDAACGNFLYSGRRRFMTQYMKHLPIPEPRSWLVDEIRSLRLAQATQDLDALIWSALGIKQVGR